MMAALTMFPFLCTMCTYLIVYHSSKVSSEPIIRGKQFGLGSYTYIAGIAINSNGKVGKHVCTGTLISPKLILTIEKCIRAPEGSTLVVHFSQHVLGGITWPPISVSEIITYRDWSEATGTYQDSHNIAILVLSRAVTGASHRLILQKAGKEDFDYTFFGWGEFNDKGTQSLLPMYTNLRRLSDEYCESRVNKGSKLAKFKVPEGLVCAATKCESVELTDGDLGGPVFRSFDKNYRYVIGIVIGRASMVYEQTKRQGRPYLVLLIEEHKTFINDVIRQHS